MKISLPLLMLALAPHALADNKKVPVIDLGYVKYSGYNNATSGINYYRGIPYAQAPIGDLRWRKPQPIEAKNNFTGTTNNASVAGPACVQSYPIFRDQSTSPLNLLPQSEDCLILDVLVPQNQTSSSAKLPVLVVIHGGGYDQGWAGSAPGDAIVHQSNGGIIFVAIQYRLGMFGFLAGSEIIEDGEANAGLLDQRAALYWIQRHIGQFGGDPSKVTIWGGSAGGGSVTYQLIAGGAVDLPPFRATIPEYPWWQPLMNASSQNIQYRQALNGANCTTLSCLRSLPTSALTAAQNTVLKQGYPSPGYAYGIFSFGPVVDGKFIRALPSEEFKQGNFYKVPLLTDRDAYEGVPYTLTNLTTQSAETMDAQIMFPSAKPSFFSRLYDLYPASNFNSTFFQRVQWFSDFIVCCPTHYMAEAMVDNLGNSSQVFKLIFAAGSQLHGADGPFLSNADINFGTAANRTLAEIMTSYWISFTVTLDPNPLRSANAPFWPSYAAGGNVTATGVAGDSVGFSVLDVTTSSIQVIRDPDEGAQCDFFSSKAYAIRN